MKYHYLIDYENVHEEGLTGLNTIEDDAVIHIFYSDRARKLDLDSFREGQILQIEALKVPVGKQSLDMQLVSYMGYLMGRERGEGNHYIIISKDNGYLNSIPFWRQIMRDGTTVEVRPQIRPKAPEESQKTGPVNVASGGVFKVLKKKPIRDRKPGSEPAAEETSAEPEKQESAEPRQEKQERRTRGRGRGRNRREKLQEVTGENREAEASAAALPENQEFSRTADTAPSNHESSEAADTAAVNHESSEAADTAAVNHESIANTDAAAENSGSSETADAATENSEASNQTGPQDNSETSAESPASTDVSAPSDVNSVFSEAETGSAESPVPAESGPASYESSEASAAEIPVSAETAAAANEHSDSADQAESLAAASEEASAAEQTEPSSSAADSEETSAPSAEKKDPDEHPEQEKKKTRAPRKPRAQKKPAQPKKTLDRNALNTSVMQTLSKSNVDAATTGKVSSIVMKYASEEQNKTRVYREIIGTFGQKEGLKIYNYIKALL